MCDVSFGKVFVLWEVMYGLGSVFQASSPFVVAALKIKT